MSKMHWAFLFVIRCKNPRAPVIVVTSEGWSQRDRNEVKSRIARSTIIIYRGGAKIKNIKEGNLSDNKSVY